MQLDPTTLTPRQIVAELDRYIVGQGDAKRAVAVAMRNRYRRERLPEHVRKEVAPKNILMIGPTGVGKTEIARRLATLAGAPFIKIEATKYTEVGYVGRDVESMVRDLAEAAVRMVSDERRTGQRRQPARDLGLAHPGRTDHQDVLGRDLAPHVVGQPLAAVAVAHRDRHGALGVGLADDVAVELGDDLARGEVLGILHSDSTSTLSLV